MPGRSAQKNKCPETISRAFGMARQKGLSIRAYEFRLAIVILSILSVRANAGICGYTVGCPCPCAELSIVDGKSNPGFSFAFSAAGGVGADAGPGATVGDCDDDGDVPDANMTTNGLATFEICNISPAILPNVSVYFPTRRYLSVTAVTDGGMAEAAAEVIALVDGVSVIPDSSLHVTAGTQTIDSLSIMGSLTFDLQAAGNPGDCMAYTIFTQAEANALAAPGEICLDIGCSPPLCKVHTARAHAIARVQVKWRGILVSFEEGNRTGEAPIPIDELSDILQVRNLDAGFLPKYEDIDRDADVDADDLKSLVECLSGPSPYIPFPNMTALQAPF